MSDDHELDAENLLNFATNRAADQHTFEDLFRAIEENEDGEGAPIDEVFDEALQGAGMGELLFALRKALYTGIVYSPRKGTFRTIGEPEEVGSATGPEIVCLCGSTRSEDAYKDEQFRLTVEEQAIVLTVAGNWKDDHKDVWAEIDGEDKEHLDELHLRKIDLADRVHVLNVNGYVGDSTLNEIEHAMRTRTPITWLEPENVPDQAIERARLYEQVKESTPDDALNRPRLSEMSLEELREEWQSSDFHEIDPRTHPLLWERAHDLWDELVERSDVEQPECPECGARNWGGGWDQPSHCRECKAEVHEELGVDPAEFEQRIGKAHAEIGGYGGER